MSYDSVRAALLAFATVRTPAAITNALREEGRSRFEELASALAEHVLEEINDEAHRLTDENVHVVMFGDDDYPKSLVRDGRPVAPILFYKGDQTLFDVPSVGMCGSRHVSPLGIKAATACGVQVSQRGLAIVSGYAKGVDTATHLAALHNGGRTVIVLAEGINHFRVKREFAEAFNPERVLVVSQFPPSQPWRAFAAMARNEIIFGLGRALVVVEAGEKGGTRAAGEGALKAEKPLFVLDFGDETPPGNRYLIDCGGVPISSAPALGAALDAVADTEPKPVQAQLF